MDLGEKLPKIGPELLKRVKIESEGSAVMATKEHMRGSDCRRHTTFTLANLPLGNRVTT